MFLPFIPFLIVLAGVTALITMGADESATAAPWVLAAWYGGLLLLGQLFAHAWGRLVPERRTFGLARRRLAWVVLWFWALSMSPLAVGLPALLAWSGAGQEAALLLLVLNYWVADALAHNPVGAGAAGTLREQLGRVLDTLRVPAPILVLVLLGTAVPLFMGTGLMGMGGVLDFGVPGLQTLAGLGLLLVIAAVAVPVLIRVCWGLQPLRTPGAEAIIRDELAANGARVRHVLSWPDAMMGQATAGVMGLFPRFRLLLISDRLAGVLTEPELRAVVAHEAGHVRQGHLWYLLAGIFAFILLMQVLISALLWGGLLMGEVAPGWLLIGLEVAALLLFFRFGLGYVSRHFERQADGEALRRVGWEPFRSAITKLGQLNGIPYEQNNWHHYGIVQRVDYLRSAEEQPEALKRHDRRVGWIKAGLVGAMVLAFGAQSGLSSPLALNFLSEQYLVQRVERLEDPGEADLAALKFLAMRAYQRGDLRGAERYFRLTLDAAPNDTETQNNLAWLLVTRENPTPHELERGLVLARQAAEASSAAYIWDTLAEAYHANARPQQAVSAADRALELAEANQGRGQESVEYYRQRLESFRQGGARS